MKKVVIPLCIVFAVLIGGVIYFISMSLALNQYKDAGFLHMMEAQNGDELIAVYKGQTTRVMDGNIGRISRIVSTGDKERLFSKPEYDAESAVTLTFSDGSNFVIAPDESAEDAAFIIYSYSGGGEICFRVKGYGAMEWTVRAVSPEGIYNPNPVIKGIGGQ